MLAICFPVSFFFIFKAFNEEKRPIWFVFAGMGSQWPGMGKRLMDLPLFRESIERSHKILESKGLDLIKIITENDPNVFDNVLHSFVGIAAIQVLISSDKRKIIFNFKVLLKLSFDCRGHRLH